MTQALTAETASGFARIALGHVEREYPHKPALVLTGPVDLRPPSALHPVFHGSFDWHSCVHGYWLLARLLRRDPSLPEADAIAALFDRRLTRERVAGECETVSRPSARGFERPYGWAWLLKLAAELDGTRWADVLRPLAAIFARRFREFLTIAPYAVRVGTHFNTAFALLMAADYADAELLALLADTAERWYGPDADCPAWGEPSADDFLSPALAEAACMRRLLPASRFLPWFDRFLPHLAAGQPATLFMPAAPTDRADGKLAHLDGLNLSRAWCFRTLAAALPDADPRAGVMRAAAERHLAASLPHVAGEYMGEHWLASFALLALEA